MRTGASNTTVVVALLWCMPLAAQPEAVNNQLEGELEISFVRTTGNSDTATGLGRIDLTAEQQHWREHLELQAFKAQESGQASAEQYSAQGKLDYKFDRHHYLYMLSSYEDHRFSGFDYRASVSLGYGKRLADTDTLTVDVEAGPGYRYSKAREPGDQGGGEAVLRAAGHLRWQFSGGARFEQDLTSAAGDEAVITESTTAVTSDLVGRLSLKIAYRIRHVSDTPRDVEPLDTRFTVGVLYGF